VAVQHDLAGLVAAITGASQGLGQAITLEMAAHGAAGGQAEALVAEVAAVAAFLASPAAGAITAQSVKAAGGLMV
jgi:NAD(P)-dependent dehydrogenase (short-subunit alcohol dehydrogenase family)